jgi:hypothetical protein
MSVIRLLELVLDEDRRVRPVFCPEISGEESDCNFASHGRVDLDPEGLAEEVDVFE